MALVLLDELLITLILFHDYKERESKEEVAKNIYNKSKCCSIEH